MAELERPDVKDWIRRRVQAVRDVYTAFDAMMEGGHGEMIPDPDTASQISCPFHGPDNRPSARFYPRMGGTHDYVHCYFCKESWDSVNLYMRIKGLRFMDALKDLERRYHVKVPVRPDMPDDYEEPPDKSSADYVSEAWQDVGRVLPILETKLRRLRDAASMTDYVKFCRVLDAVAWDLDRNKGEQTPQMVVVLDKLRKMMDGLRTLDLGTPGS